MLNRTPSFVRILLAVFLLAMSVSVAPAADPVRFEPARPEEIRGQFSVILFDNAYGHGIQRIAFLDREGDRITIEPYALVDEYKIIRNLSGPDAYKRALDFVSVPTEIRTTRLSSIIDASGALIGYELRPLYYYLSYGTEDVLEVSYRFKGEFLQVHTRLTEKVDKLFRGHDR